MRSMVVVLLAVSALVATGCGGAKSVPETLPSSLSEAAPLLNSVTAAVPGLDQAKAPGLALEKGEAPPQTLEMLKAGSGRVILASSKASEVSFAGKPYSAFTQALIESLSGIGAAEEDGFVRVSDLAMYTGFRVPVRTKERQHPVLNFDKADNFPVAYYAGGELKPKGTPFAMPAEIEPEPGQWTIKIGILNLGGQHADRIVNAGDNATIDMSSGPKRSNT